MTRLVLAISGFPAPARSDTAPRLAALERLLAGAAVSVAPARSWRHWLLGRAGIAVPPELPLARAVAGATGHWALATPLHLLAGLEHVHLDPWGPPALADDEWELLLAGFNGLFGGDGLTLSRRHGAGLLSLPRPLAVATQDPLELSGRDAGQCLPAGPDGAWLRRLMTEAQMWLHDHPLNQSRRDRGEPPVNTLWFWGLSDAPLPLPSPEAPALATADPFLKALWRTAGSVAAPAPGSFGQWLEAPDRPGLVALALGDLAREPAAALQLADRHWFGPLSGALSAGRIAAADIWLGGSVALLRRLDRLRFWRRRRAWPESLG